MKNENLIGHLTAVFTILIWGVTFISTKILMADFSPIEILFFRISIGLVVLTVLKPQRLKLLDKRHEALFMLAGLCGVTLYFALQNIALTYTYTSNVSVILSAVPFFIALFSFWFADGEKPRVNFFIGFVAAILGIGLVSFAGAALRLNPLGDLLTIGAAISWASYSLLAKKINSFSYNIIQTTRRTFFYGLVFMIPMLFIFDFKLAPERFLKPENALNFVFLGALASALCFVTWNKAVKALGAVKTSVYIYLIPVITIVTSLIVLGEEITPIALAGSVLIIAGLVISEANIDFGRFKRRLSDRRQG